MKHTIKLWDNYMNLINAIMVPYDALMTVGDSLDCFSTPTFEYLEGMLCFAYIAFQELGNDNVPGGCPDFKNRCREAIQWVTNSHEGIIGDHDCIDEMHVVVSKIDCMLHNILTWLTLQIPAFKGLLEKLCASVGEGLNKAHHIHPNNGSHVVVGASLC